MCIELLLEWLGKHKDGIEVITLIPAAFWALWIYHKSKKKEAAEWLHTLFCGFYLDPEFRKMRVHLEYDDNLCLVLKKDMDDPKAQFNDKEKEILTNLDAILNYFEFILYLEKRGQLQQADRAAMFTYWFNLLNDPSRESLRHYLKKYHYKALCEILSP